MTWAISNPFWECSEPRADFYHSISCWKTINEEPEEEITCNNSDETRPKVLSLPQQHTGNTYVHHSKQNTLQTFSWIKCTRNYMSNMQLWSWFVTLLYIYIYISHNSITTPQIIAKYMQWKNRNAFGLV